MPRRSFKDMESQLNTEPDNARPYKTLAEVAQALGVDASTVSLVLSGSDKPSDKTRKRVLEFCRKVHFRPNLMAQALSRGRSRLWGVLFPDISTSFFPGVLEGIEEIANDNNFTAFLALSKYDPNLMAQQIATMQARLVEGLLIVPTARPGEMELIAPHLGDTPYVALLQPFYGESPDKCIHVDHYAGAMMAMEYLYDLGHRRIGYINGPQFVQSNLARMAGWRDFLIGKGLSTDESLVSGYSFFFESGIEAARALLSAPEPPTALFCSSDQAALGAMETLFEMRLRPGEDVSVIGFDDLCCARNSPVPLTTIRQPQEELGRLAALALTAAINNEEPKYSSLKPELIIRRSTGPVKN